MPTAYFVLDGLSPSDIFMLNAELPTAEITAADGTEAAVYFVITVVDELAMSSWFFEFARN